MVLLNGKFVSPEEIDSSKHKFIGSFREPTPPYSDGSWEVLICPCGLSLWTAQCIFNHWQMGHMDTPQYMDIEL